MNSGFVVKEGERQRIGEWLAGLGDTAKTGVGVAFWKQGWGKLGMGQSILNTPLCLAGKTYGWGLGSHADSEIVLRCPRPAKTFRAWVGVDHNRDSAVGNAPVVFSVWANGHCLGQSPCFT
ncbi:MAG: NPCBM/NEW2 domain-containing protein, partial [Lentisphaeria bacterium]